MHARYSIHTFAMCMLLYRMHLSKVYTTLENSENFFKKSLNSGITTAIPMEIALGRNIMVINGCETFGEDWAKGIQDRARITNSCPLATESLHTAPDKILKRTMALELSKCFPWEFNLAEILWS